MVWVFQLGEKSRKSEGQAQAEQWARVLIQELPAASAAKCLMKIAGLSREEAYQAILHAQKN